LRGDRPLGRRRCTIDASKTVERIVGVFPQWICSRFGTGCRKRFSVISQRLLPRADGNGQWRAEILRATLRTREYVEQGESGGGRRSMR
jgi:twitching motility protein PilT